MKPSKITNVHAKLTKLLFKGYAAITWMGTIYCSKQTYVDAINATDTIDSGLKCHETIHVRQAESTKDSWCRYYLRYVWEWIKNIPLVFVEAHYVYLFNPFELEAYTFEDDYDYPNSPCEYWRKLAKLSIKEKYRFAKKYNSSLYGIGKFVKVFIIPYVNEKESLI